MLMVAAGVGVFAAILWTKSEESLLTVSTICGLGLGLPGMLLLTLTYFLDAAMPAAADATPAKADVEAPKGPPAHAGVRGYALAVIAVAIATALRWALDPYLSAHLPFTLFLLAVAVTGWFAGFGPAWAAACSSLLIVWFAFIVPAMGLQVFKATDPVALGIFVVLALAIGSVTALLRLSLYRSQVLAGTVAALQSSVTECEARFHRIADHAPVMIWMADTAKACTFFNQPWLEFTGATLAHELGSGWLAGVHAEDVARTLQIFDRAFATRQTFKREFRLRRGDGEYRPVIDHGVPHFDEHGQLAGYVGACVDIATLRVGVSPRAAADAP